MPLSFRDPSAVSEYTPYITWKPSIGEWQDRDGVANVSEPVVFDFPKLQVGWKTFDGGRPQWKPDADISKPEPKPDDGAEWERGFSVNMFSVKNFGDANPLREWCDTSRTAQKAIEAVYNEWEKMGDTSKAAVVQFTGAVPTAMGMKTFKMPGFTIQKLIDRPAELDKDDNSGSAAAPSSPAQPDTTEEDEFI
jgi:hypothetical protein